MSAPIVIEMANRKAGDRPDLFCRGDIFGIQWNNPTFVPRKIVEYQTVREHLGLPFDLISHVGIITVGSAWRGYEVRPPRGGYVDILDAYKDCRVHVFRPFGWSDDVARLKAIDEFIYLTNDDYAWMDVVRFYLGFLPKTSDTFCSEAIIEAYRKYGMDLLPGKDASKVTPGRLCTSPVCNHIAVINL